MPLILHAGAPVVRSGSAKVQRRDVGGWLSVQNRDRKGRPIGSTIEINGKQVPTDTGLARWLTHSEMWTIYRRVPDLRAAVDSIVRRVATWDWLVEVTADPDDPQIETLHETAAAVQRFLSAPNEDGETWQELMTKFLTDLLVFDQGAMELVFNRTGDALTEVVALRGSSIEVQRDDTGKVSGYVQDFATDDGGFGKYRKIPFEPEELLFMRLYPTTAGPQGNSLLEAIVDEVVTMLHSSKHLMMAYDADEIPPGIVVLAGLSGRAADKATQDLREMRGQDQKIRVITTPDPSNVGVKWVELRRTPKDLAMRELVNDVRRVIWRVLGVLPVEMGVTEAMPRASAQVQLDVSSSHLVNPILELVEAKVNARIIPLLLDDEEMHGKIRFHFDREAKLSIEEQKQQTDSLRELVKQGLLSRNEARAVLGYSPVENGDVLTVEGNVHPLSSAIGQPEPAPDAGGDSGEGPDTDPDNEGPEGPAPGEADEDTDAVEDESAPGEAETRSPMCRLDGESMSECVSRKVSEIMEEKPDTPMKQAVAMAYSMCSKRCGTDDRAPDRYSHINFTPPKGVREECQRGLDWKAEGESGSGDPAIQWARRLARGEDITPAKARKMKAYLARHEVDKQGEGFSPGEPGYPSAGRVAWALWGGDPAIPWSNKIVDQMDRADSEAGLSVTLAFSDLSKSVQDTLRNKAKEHNEQVDDRSMATWRKTTAPTLGKVFERGVGAYETNPESVRPEVTSAEQWAFARVNSFLYALLNDKFRSGKHDTDLLPAQHPMSTKERAVVSRVPSMPKAPLGEAWGWDSGAREDTLGDPPDWERYGRAHLWRDPNNTEAAGGYKFPVARLIEGELRLVFRGAAAVVGALKEDGKHESLRGVTVEEQREVYRLVQRIYEDFGREPPVIDRLEDTEDRSVSQRIGLLMADGLSMEAAVSRVCDDGCDCCDDTNAGHMVRAEMAYRRTGNMPSEWQPTGIFRGKRTLPLTRLGDTIAKYGRDVRPLWREARDEVAAAVSAAYDVNQGGFTEETATRAQRALQESLDKLVVRWRMATESLYQQAGRLGRDAAVDYSGTDLAGDGWEQRTAVYYETAIGYLTDPDGPIETVRRRVLEVIAPNTRRSEDSMETRVLDPELQAIVDDVVSEAAVLAAAEAAFNAQEFRIYNWSGKLNNLSNEVLLDGLNKAQQAEGIQGTVEWWAEWVYVGDRRTCSVCEDEGIQGFRPLSALSVKPGGDTPCRGNCRCVLVFWTKAEVDAATATRLGPTG